MFQYIWSLYFIHFTYSNNLFYYICYYLLLIILLFIYCLLLQYVKSQEFIVYNFVNFISIIYDKRVQKLYYSKLNVFILIHCGFYIIYITICFNTFEAYFSCISHILKFPLKPSYSIMNKLVYRWIYVYKIILFYDIIKLLFNYYLLLF